MSEMLVQFAELVRDEDGRPYIARAYGAPIPNDTLWEGWIEFVPVSPASPVSNVDGPGAEDGGHVLASGRETTQPNRTDTEYWATGLTPVYLEGALQRALHPLAAGETARSGAARPRSRIYPGGRRTRTVA